MDENRRSKRSLEMSKKVKKLLYVLLLSSISLPLWAFTSLAHSCPDEFVATALHFSTSQAPLSLTHKINVLFQVERTVRGAEQKKLNVSFLPLEEVEIKVGKQYRVSIENGFLCSLEML
jgi:hypothetical protein